MRFIERSEVVPPTGRWIFLLNSYFFLSIYSVAAFSSFEAFRISFWP